MELNYIWVESYKIIEKTGINFSNSRGLSFIYDGKVLKPQFGAKPILDFGQSIASVTAIAGQNGSGKTSLCEVIIRSVATMVNGSMGYSLRFKGIISLGNRILKHEGLAIENLEELSKLGFDVSEYKDSPLENLFPQRHEDILGVGFIYYSNIIDWRGGMDEANLVNISTVNLIFNNIYSSPFFYFTSRYDSFVEERFRYYDQKTSVQAFHREEHHRFTKFILSHSDMIPFKQPDSFEIFISHSDENRWINLDSLAPDKVAPYNEFQSMIREAIFSSYESVEQETTRSLTREQFIQSATHLYRLNITQLFAIKKEILIGEEDLRGFIYFEKIPSTFSEYSDQIRLVLLLFDKIISKSQKELTFKPRSESLFYPGGNDWRLNFLQHFTLRNSEENGKLLSDFIFQEEILAQDGNNNRFRISSCLLEPYPSAGEYSFLALFSRLYGSISDYVNGYDDKRNIILFIDEGDMAFHPAWKKKMLYWLKEFLNKDFNPLKFQLILTSHSPYLLSDLHSENLVLLRKGAKGKTEVVKSDSKRTFSANIHELLADSFFMEDGFIGEHAKSTLEDLVVYLQQEKLETNQWNKGKAKTIIEIIGDDIIRDRLEDLYIEKFGEGLESLKDERNRLRDRLIEIEREIRNDQN